jgi:uncharacterized protein (DUF2252 family)
MDAPSSIRDYNRGRDPERLALKYARMRASEFAFLRGSCHLFYERIGQHDLPRGPLVWACGDLHLENLGSYRGDNRQVYFDINDFDEALLAPPTWDLVRACSSVFAARRELGVGRREARGLTRELVRAYASALSLGTARWIERETAVAPVAGLLTRVRTRKRRALLDARTVLRGKRRVLRVDGQKALPASEAEADAVRDFFARLSKASDSPRELEVLDVARRIAGTGSLGLPRYVVLVRGKGSPHQNRLLDLKAALPPSAPRGGVLPRQKPVFADHAARIVEVQRRMQAIPMASLSAVSLEGRPFVLRRLLPSEDRVALTSLRDRPAQARALVGDVGQCLAWDQLRSSGRDGSARADALIAFGTDPAWQRQLLSLAEHAAAELAADFADYARAYDAGELAPPADTAPLHGRGTRAATRLRSPAR